MESPLPFFWISLPFRYDIDLILIQRKLFRFTLFRFLSLKSLEKRIALPFI
jgi:hypothetical protein